jgi:hypothetical protein
MKMNYFFRLILLSFVAFTGLILGSGMANAAAPAPLEVGMAFRPYGGDAVPLNYGARVKVVPKVTTNGITIPIAASPYFGRHFDINNNGSPDNNDHTFGIDTTPKTNIFGGTFGSTLLKNFTWCGNSGGVPDKEFQMDVSVYYSGAGNEITYNGRTYKGSWVGFYNFEAPGTLGEKSFFNGSSIRVPALNPYKNFVYFEFKEASPNYGTLSTQKYAIGQPAAYSDRFTSAAAAYGSVVPSGTKLVSSNGGYEAIWDENGEGQIKVYDLMGGSRVLYHTAGPKSTATTKNVLCLQDDGNLVIRANYCRSGTTIGTTLWASFGTTTSNPVWTRSGTATAGYGSSAVHYLKMQDDGNLSVYNSSNLFIATSSTLRIGMLDHQPPASTTSVVANAQVKYSAAYGTNPVSYTQFYPDTTADEIADSKKNPADRANVDANQGPFKAEITVPKGYDLVSSFVMDYNDNNTKATPNASCTANAADGTQTCIITNITVTKGVTTGIDAVMRPEPPSGYFDDVCNNLRGAELDSYFTARNLTKADVRTKAWGWAYDPSLVQVSTDKTKTPSKVVVIFDDGKITEDTVTVVADVQRDDVGIAYPSFGKWHGFKFDVPEKYFDGNSHTAKAYVDRYGDGTLLTQLPKGDSTKTDLNFTCPDIHYFPWLQTKQGDVMADGQIDGQYASIDNKTYPGGRKSDPTAAQGKEAEFLVISAVADGGPFCSTYNYILTNTSAAAGQNCSNGGGYSFNPNSVDASGVAVGKVFTGVQQAYNDNGAGAAGSAACTDVSKVYTASALPSPANISCTGSIIYKIAPGNLGSVTVSKGRATIFVEGDLNITGNINYADNTAQGDPRLAPSLAIVASGNINIDKGVSTIAASLYSNKKIDTCSDTIINNCATRLIVQGSMSSREGYAFDRTYVDTTNRTSAELINLGWQTVMFPPPGIESRYFYNDFSSYKLDTAEYQPRF